MFRKIRFQMIANILIYAGEIRAAAQHQLLRYSSLETKMPLFHIAVLVAMTSLCLLALQPVEAHQAFVTISEICRISHVVDRRREPVGAMPMRHFAQLPQRVLQPFAQALKALGKAHRSRLPVRVRQHEVIDQVRKTLPLYRHPQLFHVREVGSAQPPRRMLLGEEHLLSRTFSRSPVLHATLQRAQLPVLKMAGVLPLQILENGLSLKTGVSFKQLLNIVPDLNERVGPGSSTHCRWHLAWQPASATILPRSLGFHSSLGRGNLLVFLCAYQRKQPPNLPVCDQSASALTHRNPLGLIVSVRALTRRFCYRARVVASLKMLPKVKAPRRAK